MSYIDDFLGRYINIGFGRKVDFNSSPLKEDGFRIIKFISYFTNDCTYNASLWINIQDDLIVRIRGKSQFAYLFDILTSKDRFIDIFCSVLEIYKEYEVGNYDKNDTFFEKLAEDLMNEIFSMNRVFKEIYGLK